MAAEDKDRVDVVVIGGGPGGYPAALEAARHGMKVVLVDDAATLGGVCLLRGCIPSKMLLHAARVVFETKESSEWGVHFQPPTIDLDALRRAKQAVIDQLSTGVAQLCKQRGVQRIQAHARFTDAHTLELRGGEGIPERLSFEHAIISTGSYPTMPRPFQIDDPRVMDSSGALELFDIPERLLVIGGGYIGLELGTVYAALGSRVTVVEMMGGLLLGADRELVRPLARRLETLFEKIHLDTKVSKLTATAEGIQAELEGKDIASLQMFDRVLVAVGRSPRSRDLGLERAGVHKDDDGFIPVDARRRTNQPHIFAVGDVAGEPMLAHKATREGKVAAQAIAGEAVQFDNRVIPAAVFTDPEIAWCGLTETEAKAAGRKVEVSRFPWKASGRAVSLGRTEGLTKLIFDPETERLLGMGVVGPEADAIIAEGALAIEMGAVARDVADTIHAHPTLAETMMEAAERFLGEATHIDSTNRRRP